jgi:hypothetical protein
MIFGTQESEVRKPKSMGLCGALAASTRVLAIGSIKEGKAVATLEHSLLG